MLQLTQGDLFEQRQIFQVVETVIFQLKYTERAQMSSWQFYEEGQQVQLYEEDERAWCPLI